MREGKEERVEGRQGGKEEKLIIPSRRENREGDRFGEEQEFGYIWSKMHTDNSEDSPKKCDLHSMGKVELWQFRFFLNDMIVLHLLKMWKRTQRGT